MYIRGVGGVYYEAAGIVPSVKGLGNPHLILIFKTLRLKSKTATWGHRVVITRP